MHKHTDEALYFPWRLYARIVFNTSTVVEYFHSLINGLRSCLLTQDSYVLLLDYQNEYSGVVTCSRNYSYTKLLVAGDPGNPSPGLMNSYV